MKFSKELCETIYDLVSKGYTNEEICAVCDIGTSTFYRWIDRGKKAKSGNYKQFVKNLEKAKAHRKNHFLDKLIEKAEDRGDWKAYAWLLERGWDEQFARPEVKVKQEVEAKVDAEVKLEAQVNLLDNIKKKREELNDIDKD